MKRALILVLAGCSGTSPGLDGSVTCLTSAGTAFPPLPAYGVVGERVAFSIPEGPSSTCAPPDAGLTASVEIIDPLGNKTSGSASTSAIAEGGLVGRSYSYRVDTELTPTLAGRWTVNVAWSTGFVQTAFLPVASVRNTAPPVRRTYVDRVDYCLFSPYLSASGLLFCAREDDQVWVYDTNGQIRTHFPGRGVLVSGSDIWSFVNSELEHRTDVSGTLRFDGAVTGPFGSARGEVRNGSIQRELADGGFMTVTWDGGTLGSERLEAPVPFGSTAFVVENGVLWNQDGCFERRGCQQTNCGFVRLCADQPGVTTSFEAEAAFGVSHVYDGQVLGGAYVSVLVMRPRPFSLSAPVQSFVFVDARAGSPEFTVGGWSGYGPPDKAVVVTQRHVLFPKRVGESLMVEAVPRNGTRVVGVADDWLLEITDPFTLVATKLR